MDYRYLTAEIKKIIEQARANERTIVVLKIDEILANQNVDAVVRKLVLQVGKPD